MTAQSPRRPGANRTGPERRFLNATNEEIVERFHDHLRMRRKADTTLKLRGYWARRFLAWCQENDLTLRTVTTNDLDAFLYSGNWKTATQSSAVSSLRVLYGWAVRTHLVDADPTEDLEAIRVRRTPSRIAKDHEIIEGLQNARNATERAILRLGAECGLRVNEIATLPLAARDGDWITVTGKGGVVRSVYSSTELRADLEEIEASSARWGYYFPGKSPGPRHPSTLWRMVRKLCGVNPHSLRHRAGTAVYHGSGKDIRVTQHFLGHASINTTSIYVHVERDDLVIAARASRLNTSLNTNDVRSISIASRAKKALAEGAA